MKYKISVVLIAGVLITGFQPVWADTKFTVGVDPRVEIISIIQLLSVVANDAPFLVSSFDSFEYEYKNKVLTHFSKFAKHKVVKMFNETAAKLPGFSLSGD